MIQHPRQQQRQQRRHQNQPAAHADNLSHTLIKHLHLLMTAAKLGFKQRPEAPQRGFSGATGVH